MFQHSVGLPVSSLRYASTSTLKQCKFTLLFWGQVKKYVGIIFEKHLKFAMLKTYILPKYYKSSTSDEHLIGRQHCNSEVMFITHRVFGLTPFLAYWRTVYKK
ncbi:hypothetical protein HMPREF2533_04202 [Bacteroides fragilis]|uniref:Uncharacterized protein n=1 Tax=Bacteroides fragilis (strain ATCC 25285 / DSM 2151 / CCUG 4856 / JCM 11019 / LMG 10263 / NCTC 9343 / Onslow / VPI 2553 / EN-2) TaxID=272559 RepID=Q5LFW8_BACFN|nr:hypothetical protein HMPREF2530_04202 [Bacteroides fragilis]KXU41091.1 hypothetical protein HMPREF2533_04202 [Bacteroides fragilis]OOD25870.1 hypothetical protein BWP07_11270 [Bacteroides fragilis]QCT77812.1 hypothetical protein E0L14_10525 [Bacteroides fragilis]CAH06975.1 hypothetical protein BF9343_1194 [Bacteroides fragilis NCTC 9343]